MIAPVPATDDFVFELVGEGPMPVEAIEAWAALLVHLVENADQAEASE